MFDSLEAARAMLRRVPRFPFRLVARLELADAAPARVEKTFGPGQYTVWSDANVLLDAVVAVVEIES